MANTFYPVTPIAGQTFTEATTDQRAALGAQVMGNTGTIWEYVQATSAIGANTCVSIVDNAIRPVTKALADVNPNFGFPQFAFTAAQYGWIPRTANGTITVKVKASCAPFVGLYTTSSAGVLDDTSASQTKIEGIVTTTTNTSSVTITRPARVMWPFVTTAA